MPAMIRRASAISSGENWAKSFLRSTPRAENDHVLGKRVEVLLVFESSVDPESSTASIARSFDSEPLPVCEASARPPLRLWRPKARRHVELVLLERIPVERLQARSRRQNRRKHRVEDGDVLRRGDQGGLCSVVEIVTAVAVDRRNRFDQIDYLAGADIQPAARKSRARVREVRRQPCLLRIVFEGLRLV